MLSEEDDIDDVLIRLQAEIEIVKKNITELLDKEKVTKDDGTLLRIIKQRAELLTKIADLERQRAELERQRADELQQQLGNRLTYDVGLVNNGPT